MKERNFFLWDDDDYRTSLEEYLDELLEDDDYINSSRREALELITRLIEDENYANIDNLGD